MKHEDGLVVVEALAGNGRLAYRGCWNASTADEVRKLGKVRFWRPADPHPHAGSWCRYRGHRFDKRLNRMVYGEWIPVSESDSHWVESSRVVPE